MSTEPTVLAVLTAIARAHRPELVAVTHTDSLVDDLGFESLDMAQAVAELEIRLHVDPFATDVTIASVRTVGDFVAAYRRAAGDT